MYAACGLASTLCSRCRQTLSWPGLLKQVLLSRGSCCLASVNGVVGSLSPGEGRTVIQILSCSRSAAAAERLGAALAVK